MVVAGVWIERYMVLVEVELPSDLRSQYNEQWGTCIKLSESRNAVWSDYAELRALAPGIRSPYQVQGL